MAKPRVFISSTYYDLKHVRASLDLFVDSLGFEPVLSEKGNIAYAFDRPLDESCYREAESADIYVLIVGGRYGSEASPNSKEVPVAFFERYDSITKREYDAASGRDVPTYVLIEKGVHSEYQTFLKNRDNTTIQYAHVDSVNVFTLIEGILSKPRNNPIYTFERFEEIHFWLREQWSGLFRELLRRHSDSKQLASLTMRVAELKEVNDTLKTYLEAVMRGGARQEYADLIESEKRRLEEARKSELLRSNKWIDYICEISEVEFDVAVEMIQKATSFEDYAIRLISLAKDRDGAFRANETLLSAEGAQRDFNRARKMLGLPPFATSGANQEVMIKHISDRLQELKDLATSKKPVEKKKP
jgi:hypothetical protein